MKKTLTTISIAIMLIACGGETPAPTSQLDGGTASHYGDIIDANGALSIADLYTQMEGQTSVNTKFEGKIVQTCRKKGCWMSIDMGIDTMYVQFKGGCSNGGFFVPVEGVDGKTMIAEGVCTWDTSDVDWLRHLAEDAGKSIDEINAITEPKITMNFEANGVIIKDHTDAVD